MKTLVGWLLTIALCGTAVAAPVPTDGWIATLEGGWSGRENATPMGQMPMVLIFERMEDESLRAYSAMNRETFIELRFVKAADGRWLLEERAAMEGLGEQAYTLEPVEAPGELRRWVYAEAPEFLRVDVAVDENALFLDVALRGEPHAQFDMARVPPEELPAMREAMAAAAEREPSEGSIHSFANDRHVPRSILEARNAVAAAPTDARAHLKLGTAIGEILSADPMTAGPLFAAEMLASLNRALELDPSIPETYQWLAGYYLNAPPIAGGSVDEAEEMARRLVEIDPKAGADLLDMIQRTRGRMVGRRE